MYKVSKYVISQFAFTKKPILSLLESRPRPIFLYSFYIFLLLPWHTQPSQQPMELFDISASDTYIQEVLSM